MNSLESYITCPYDGSHRILKARYPKHLLKCRKNYPKDMKIVCCFDVTHLLDPDEYEHHLNICPTSGNLKCYETSLEPDREVGTIPIQKACNLETNTITEDWFGNNPTYDPLAASEKKNVFRVPIAMSKSEKKKFKAYERQRLLSLEKEGVQKVQKVEKTPTPNKIENDEPLREPKNVAKAMTSYNANISIDNISFHLKDMLLDKQNNTSLSENSCNLDNNVSKKDNKKNDLTNTSSNKVNNSSKQMNISGSNQNTKMERSTSGSEHLKTCANASEKNDLQTNDSKQKLNKYYTSESQKQVRLNGQKGILYGEPKKVGTGRGFILAYQHSKSNIMKKQEQYKNPEVCSSISDYD